MHAPNYSSKMPITVPQAIDHCELAHWVAALNCGRLLTTKLFMCCDLVQDLWGDLVGVKWDSGYLKSSKRNWHYKTKPIFTDKVNKNLNSTLKWRDYFKGYFVKQAMHVNIHSRTSISVVSGIRNYKVI